MKLAIIAALSAGAFAQTFEVATIKPSPPLESLNGRIFMGPRGGPGTADPGRFWCDFCQAADLVSLAYDVPNYRILNSARLPADRYHVVATLPAGASKEQFRAMLRQFLAERFRLATHSETREMPIYRLIVTSGGPKLKEHVEGVPRPPEDPSKPRVPGVSYRQQNKSIADFARMLEGQLRTPVEDATALDRKYDFDVSWSFRDAVDSPLPDVFGALQSIGLKLVSRKGSLDCVAVDRAEKPTEN